MSLPEFFDGKGSYQYVYVNGAFREVESITSSEKEVFLVFTDQLAKDSLVEVPVRLVYDVQSEETVTLTIQ